MNNNLHWLIAILILAQPQINKQEFNNQTNNILYAITHIDEIQKFKTIRENCNDMEFEQDMGKTLQVCKIDGQYCNMQCIRRQNDNYSYNDNAANVCRM